jgi:phosphomannomutase
MPQRILSISGLRGVVGDGLEPAYLADFASALGTLFKGGTVVLSRDGRSTGPMVRHAVLSGLLATGCRVVDAGIAATPTCGVLVTQLRAAGGLQITASHNPIEWNGLKPFGPEGSVFDQRKGQELLRLLEGGEIRYARHSGLGTVEELPDAHAAHLERVLAQVDAESIKRRRFRVVLDCSHGAGALLGPRLLEALGCETHVLGGAPDGEFEHPPEPLEQNLRGLCDEVHRRGADLGFAQDPDADRLAIVDERGRYIGEELTLALCVDHLLPERQGPVVVNGSTSRVTADLAARHNRPFLRSYVGEANVVAKMREVGASVGGEGNGGLIDPKIGYVRDSFAAMAYCLAGLARLGEPLSGWVARLPVYAIVKDKIACQPERVRDSIAALKQHFHDASAALGDGLRLDWPDRWVQVRASNTEPIIRVIAEAPQAAHAQELCRQAMQVVAAAVGSAP